MFKQMSLQQIDYKIAFMDNYIKAANAADGSTVDANANVTQKTMATLESELYKQDTIQINRGLIYRELRELFGAQTARQYLRDIKNHLIYVHDETSLKPYCASVSLYPFLFEGTKNLGGTSNAPKNLQSFCGSFVNLVYQLASGFAGAVATVEFLMYFDYFAKKQYGDYYLYSNAKEIDQEFQGVIYALNQPSSARGDQSVFWNISVFDENYFKELFGTFRFPDGTGADWEALKSLQYYFMGWFSKERKKELLTFPVITAAMLIDKETKTPVDAENAQYLAQYMSRGLSFFVYMSESADSLASCCRLRNEISENTFSYTLGAGGVSTGSKQVITINFNRLAQTATDLETLVGNVHKYLLAHNSILKKNIKAGLLPAYDAGYINFDKQFLTIGINGAVEAAEFLRIEPKENDNYIAFLTKNLSFIAALNKAAAKKYGVRFNTEFVPAESLGVKNAAWDKKDGLKVNRDCYNSYFYPVEDTSMSILEKLKLHGAKVSQYLDGGAAVHLNLEQLPTFETALKLINTAAAHGVPYWTFNVLCTICDACGHIDPNTLKKCPECGNTDKIDYGTRIIGYLKRVSNFSTARQKEHARRFYEKYRES